MQLVRQADEHLVALRPARITRIAKDIGPNLRLSEAGRVGEVMNTQKTVRAVRNYQ
jgi:hypothetical protein